jgi:glycine/sarcosine/betaine reductase complex component C subunit beta
VSAAGRPVAVLGASMTLEHVPDLVRFGSKPWRERDSFASSGAERLRSFADAVAYAPNQVMIGNRSPFDLWELERPWWAATSDDGSATPVGASGEILEQRSFYELLTEVDRFDLLRPKQEPRDGELLLVDGAEPFAAFRGEHDADPSLSAEVLLENLAVKASAVHALRHLLSSGCIDPTDVGYVLGCGEEAVGDRYQRGGGNLAKAVAEDCGLSEASGADVKAFCAAPLHAIVSGASLVAAGVHDVVVVVAGGSLAKLGMKFLGAIKGDGPIVEDVLAGVALAVGRDDAAPDGCPRVRLDAVGHHRVGAGSSQQALLEDLVARPLEALGRRMTDVDRYATELHNPEITEPAGGGDVPARNYRMLAGLGVMRGELTREEIAGFAHDRGLPGFAPSQGHIASAVPWLPHALASFQAGTLETTMLLAKGSLFLGRMTRQWDGASIVLEV